MGWYLRKSFGFGPLRLNLSKSGLGYSVGVRGARIGVGPRGNYVRLGRGGIYYQKYFSPSSDGSRPQPTTPVSDVAQVGTPVVTAPADQLHDSTSEGLLAEIREKHQKTSIAPIFAVFSGLFIVGLLSASASTWALIALVLLLVPIHALLARRDWERKLVIVNYDLDSQARTRYVQFVSAMQTFANSARIWRVTSFQNGVDGKYHGGANTVLEKKLVSLRVRAPKGLQTTVAVWALELRDQTLYFFPDRILVFEGNQVGAVTYGSISISLGQTRFVEDGDVPADAQVVDHTWRYVNRNGTPDRRFSNNRQLPVALYSQINILSPSGMNIALESSNLNKAAAFKTGLEQYIRNA